MFRRTLPLLTVIFAACGGAVQNGVSEDPFTSDVATLLTFEFDGVLTTSTPASPKSQIRAQLLYTVGQLNAQSSVARLDRVQLSGITSTWLSSGLTRIRYHAKLPVAWGSKTNLPSTYAFALPQRVDTAGLTAFFNKYSPTCNAAAGHQMMVGNFWYHYRPAISGCAIAAADRSAPVAAASVSPLNTNAKYPEYHKVWEDRSLDVLAVFGKYEKGATSDFDAGIAAYNEFVAYMRAELGAGAAVSPSGLPSSPGAANPDVVFTLDLGGGRNATISALLVDEVSSASAAWAKRYAELVAGADMILYNGHAGLGANVAALEKMGAFFPAKYQVIFFDGCDTFAYADDTLAQRRAALNPDDPAGTRYLDVITNAMPAYFANMADGSMALIRALLHPEAPKSYQAIFRETAQSHVVVAQGEEDNAFAPGLLLAPRWNALRETGFVGKAETVQYTVDLAAGTYSFQLMPDAAFAGGDADLRVRAGSAPPLTAEFKCKSYVYNSNEKCTMKLAAPARVYMTVTGDKLGVQSRYVLRAWGG